MVRRQLGVALAAVLGLASLAASVGPQDECLVGFHDHNGPLADGTTLCQNGTKCTFDLEMCLNQDAQGCTPANFTLKKTFHASGHCGPVGKLLVKPSGSSSPCGAFAGIKVRTKKNGKRPGKCKIKGAVRTSKTQARTDVDTLTLVCNPASIPCPTTTTTTPVTTTTTTTLRCGNGVVDSGEVCDPPGSQAQCAAGQACAADCASCMQVSCDAIVPGQAIANTYNIQDVMGPKVCTPGSAMNELGTCQSDADCGGSGCTQTPWIDAGGIILPFPLGISATYTIGAADSPPTCSHQACISCGDPTATCAGLTGCNGGNPKCINSPAICCDQPGFVVPTFYLSALGTCVKVDQKACGVGVVNTSNPQTGDNEVTKMGDTSDPGADCIYGTPDDPAPKACDVTAGDAGADTKGKVVRTVGNGTPDASGIHSRLGVSIMATAWTDKPTTPAASACPGNGTFDAHNCVGGSNAGAACTTGTDCNSGTCSPGPEVLLSQLLLNAELSTAGAKAGFADLNGDGCALPTGALGFGAASPGPVTLAAPTLNPEPYGGGNSMMGSVGVVFPGNGPTYDLGFVALVPFGQPTVIASQSCTCNPTPGCPE